jgi:hypothetical protein
VRQVFIAGQFLNSGGAVDGNRLTRRIDDENDFGAAREINADLLIDIASRVARRKDLDDGIRSDYGDACAFIVVIADSFIRKIRDIGDKRPPRFAWRRKLELPFGTDASSAVVARPLQ